MGQQPKTLTPHVSPRHFLGAELRHWRELRGLSAAQLAGQVFVSPDFVTKVEKAVRTAHAELIQSCDRVLDTGGALGRVLGYVTHLERTAVPVPVPASVHLSQSASIVVRFTAEVAAPDAHMDLGHRSGTSDGEARVYSLDGRRRSRDGP